MKFVLELSWLWKSIAIIILVIAFCEICALLICKLMKRKFSKKTAIIIAVVATVATGLAIVFVCNKDNHLLCRWERKSFSEERSDKIKTP